jgi:hypothetical protein
MVSKISLSRVFSVLLVVLIINGSASASPLNAALGTGFTYQGKLTDGGVPANGSYDLEFKLYTAISGGIQIGSTVVKNDATVSAGLFTVQLDFGNVFDGTALYLEIGVRAGASTGAYTALTPRTQLTATPYAIYASKAPWSGLTGVPAGFADGTDDSGASYQNMIIVAKSNGNFTSITAALNSITTASTSNRYLIFVAPGVYNERVAMKQYVDIEGSGELTTKITYGADPANNEIATLLGASNAELRSLTVENTGGADYATAIFNTAAPRLTHVTVSTLGGKTSYGLYNFGSSSIMTDVTVNVAGSGDSIGILNYSSSPTMTNVTITASGGLTFSYGVFNQGVSNPTMTNVTASASGAATNMGVFNDTSNPKMNSVTASASGGTNNYGIKNSSSSPTMTDITASASGGTNNAGVHNVLSSSIITNLTATASGGTNNWAVYNDNSPLTMRNVTATASGALALDNRGVYNYGGTPKMMDILASATGGTNSYGVVNSFSQPTITNLTASASGGTNNYGLYNSSASPTINNSVISGGYGIYNYAPSGSYTVVVHNSQISGTIYGLYNSTAYIVSLYHSNLDGSHNVFVGVLYCYGVSQGSIFFTGPGTGWDC